MLVLSVGDLERALAAIGMRAPVRFDEVTGSTNATALDMAEQGSEEWTLVATGHQTAGRGRLGRTWTDVPGGALLFSIVLRPAWAPGTASLLPLLAGASMAEAATRTGGAPVLCDWPNDLLLGDGKVGGILTASVVEDGAIRHAVVGVGVNLAAPPEQPDARGLGRVDPGALLTAFLERFAMTYRLPEERVVDETRRAWRAVSATLGREIEITRMDGSRERGLALDVDHRGALVVRTEHGEMTFASGEVRHADH